MTPLLLLALSAAGGLGAAARMLVDGHVRQRAGDLLPWGTILINVSGSLLLGLAEGPLPTAWELVLGTGFLGGYTTFSTASVETVRLAQERRVVAAVVNAFGTLLVATAAAALGHLLGVTLG